MPISISHAAGGFRLVKYEVQEEAEIFPSITGVIFLEEEEARQLHIFLGLFLDAEKTSAGAA